jgi:hypothetical protein
MTKTEMHSEGKWELLCMKDGQAKGSYVDSEKKAQEER